MSEGGNKTGAEATAQAEDHYCAQAEMRDGSLCRLFACNFL